MSETELWSFNRDDDCGIRVTLKSSHEVPVFSELNMRWGDGKRVQFPVVMTDVDLQNMVDMILEYASKHDILIKLPREELNQR
jgi:hypothetical protein